METLKDYKLRHHTHPRLPALAAQIRSVAAENPQLYDIFTKREEMEPKLRHTRSIYLTAPQLQPNTRITRTTDTANILECGPTRQYARFAPAIDEVLDLVRSELGVSRIGRVFVTKLLAHSAIDPHVDQGDYFKLYHRIHVPLQTQPGCAFTVDDHTEEMVEGDLYLMNNCLTHSVTNSSSLDRVHLIIDAI